MDNIEVLLIGGPCDGMRQRVMRGQPYLDAQPMKMCPSLGNNNDVFTEIGQIFSYRRVSLRGDNHAEYDVYVYNDVDVIGTLIRNYRDHKEPVRRV